MEKSYYNVLETLLLIYAADEGKLKIYLKKKVDEPYKGYWTLPSAPLDNQTTLEDNANIIYKSVTNLELTNIYEGKTFSNLDRDQNNRIIGTTFITLVDKTLIDLKKDDDDKSWFDVDELPKLGFDHEAIINDITKELKQKIVTNYDDMLLNCFPSDFTLPEMQSFYENMLGKTIDRRNFHKKFAGQELVIDTGVKTSKGTGRPGALYRFNTFKMKGKRI